MNKYLIAGLGNPGKEYIMTRHNIGFRIADAFANEQKAEFSQERHVLYAELSIKNLNIFLIKPTTYMNLSGKAIKYWKDKLNIAESNILIAADELALPFERIQIKSQGGSGGHNGLKSIENLIETKKYARLRFGIGNHFPPGSQADYVLENFSSEEEDLLDKLILKSVDIIKSFCLYGIELTMTNFNKR